MSKKEIKYFEWNQNYTFAAWAFKTRWLFKIIIKMNCVCCPISALEPFTEVTDPDEVLHYMLEKEFLEELHEINMSKEFGKDIDTF